jgi:hypothetical protein
MWQKFSGLMTAAAMVSLVCAGVAAETPYPAGPVKVVELWAMDGCFCAATAGTQLDRCTAVFPQVLAMAADE